MGEHPPATPAIGAMAVGLRFQLRHFWLHALPMLYQGHVEEVEMECRGVRAVDDLKLMYAPPGIPDDGKRVDVDYYQIKFHVSQADHVNLSHPWLKKRTKHQPAVADNSKTVTRIPVPDSWTWTTIESLLPPTEIVTYGMLKPVWLESGAPTVRVTEMKTGAIDVDSLPRCDQSRADNFQKTTLKEGDLLISKHGTIGKTAFVAAALTGGNITQHVLRLPLSSLLSKEYIRLSIDSPWCQTYRQLNHADQQRRLLLEAVLAEALGGRLTVEEESHANVA